MPTKIRLKWKQGLETWGANAVVAGVPVETHINQTMGDNVGTYVFQYNDSHVKHIIKVNLHIKT